MKMDNTASSPLSMHKTSHAISKPKPKIRIIHIFAPEIIKIDAANFRELVQRLTGKPTDDDLNSNKTSRRKEGKMERAMRGGFGERVKEEEEIWRDAGADSGGSFLAGFAELDGFMQELDDRFFPFLEGTTQMDLYG